MSLTRSQLAAMIDHTVLRPEAVPADVARLAAEGAELGVASVCVSPSLVRHTPRLVPVCAVVGFPSGAHLLDVKVHEAARAVADGADELDMVIDLGAAHAGDLEAVAREVAAVKAVAYDRPLKVILEAATFASPALVGVATVVRDAGADFLKTSTGFHPAGGATVETVSLLAEVAAGADRVVQVKAAGGIRDYPTALAMVDAGAHRIGASATRTILDGCPRQV